MNPSRIFRSTLLGVAASLAFSAASAVDVEANRRAGDVLRTAMPLGVAAYELWRGDHEGLRQFAVSWALTVGATEVLKRTIHVERPDRSNDQSFPSGHASNAFAAATFVHRRHGLDAAWPLYAAATYVGWTRVQADRHRWGDVAGSAALAAASTWWLVTPARSTGVSVVPTVAPGSVSIVVQARW